jgi:hypothetical protein
MRSRVADWQAVFERHRGVLRVWSQEQLPTKDAEDQRERAAARAGETLVGLLRRFRRSHLLPARDTGFVLAGLLLNFPPSAGVLPGFATPEQVGDTIGYILGRAVFGLDVTAAGEIQKL